MQLDDVCEKSEVPGSQVLRLISLISAPEAFQLIALLLLLLFFRRTTEEQNLVAYIDNGKLFFCTSREILPEHELLFYYGREYSRQLGKTAS